VTGLTQLLQAAGALLEELGDDAFLVLGKIGYLFRHMKTSTANCAHNGLFKQL
jgi:hypothetical protein